jgi:hypothetical protein
MPEPYLKVISMGDYTGILQALLGSEVRGIRRHVVVRFKTSRRKQRDMCDSRNLYGVKVAYVWGERIHMSVHLGNDGNQTHCLHVLMRATTEIPKEPVSVIDSVYDIKQSSQELLLDLKQHGLTKPPKLAVVDAVLGFWGARREVDPKTMEHRCCVRKGANFVNMTPKVLYAKAKSDGHSIWLSETRKTAVKAFDHFLEDYGGKVREGVQLPLESSRCSSLCRRLPTGTLGTLGTLGARTEDKPHRKQLRDDPRPPSLHETRCREEGRPKHEGHARVEAGQDCSGRHHSVRVLE